MTVAGREAVSSAARGVLQKAVTEFNASVERSGRVQHAAKHYTVDSTELMVHHTRTIIELQHIAGNLIETIRVLIEEIEAR